MNTINPVEISHSSSSSPDLSADTPACSVCGRQDETIRSVVYPFVISVIVITFRRALSGTWCAKHRRQNNFLASIVTATLGWFGIPFGLIYTPAALYKLARGGDQPAGINGDNLKSIGLLKMQNNDPAGAIRCFEESLKFKEDEQVISWIRQIRDKTSRGSQPTRSRSVGAYLGMIFGALLIGIVIGILDMIITDFLARLMVQVESILVVLLSWVPFLILCSLGGVVLFQLIERSLSKITHPKKGLFSSLGILAGILAVYGILHGSAIADNFYYYLKGGSTESITYEIIVTLLTLLFGGISWFFYIIDIQFTSDIIYLVLMGIVLVFYIMLASNAAKRTFQWRELIQKNHQPEI